MLNRLNTKLVVAVLLLLIGTSYGKSFFSSEKTNGCSPRILAPSTANPSFLDQISIYTEWDGRRIDIANHGELATHFQPNKRSTTCNVAPEFVEDVDVSSR